jgi:hypothetical protein
VLLDDADAAVEMRQADPRRQARQPRRDRAAGLQPARPSGASESETA